MIEINYLAVLVAAVANMVIGALWYSPVLFAKPWMKLVGKSEEEIKKQGTGSMYLLTFIGALILAYVLAHLLALTNVVTTGEALQVAIWTWLGFTVTTTFSGYLFEDRPKKLFLINIAYYLVSVIVMALILHLWK
jgi:hypothetical protein